MCDMDHCVLRTSLSPRNFWRRFYGCQHWSLVCIKIICSSNNFVCELLNLSNFIVVYMVWILLQDSNQACKFFRWLDKGPCPCGRATAPIVWERFTRLAAEAEAAKNERDNVRWMETKALEREQIAKHSAEKSRVAVWTAEEKVHKYRIALITPWLIIGLYFVFTPMFGGNGQRQLCLPWVCILI